MIKEIKEKRIIKCDSCRYLTEVIGGWYCKKLKYPLENGYAMEYHSKYCGSWINSKKENNNIKVGENKNN